MGELLTPAQLWKNFDPIAESLDATLIKTEMTGNIKIEYFYFNGRHFDTEASRVYCVVASCAESRPTLLAVDEPEKPIDVGNLVYWASKGYTAAAIDYAGDLGSGKHTVYPECIGYCNYQNSGRHLTHVDTDASETCWYEYSLNTMRAVSFLIEQKNIDVNDISLYSVGKSSRIAIQCLAIDKRLRTACIVYGKVWEDYKDDSVDRISFDADKIDKSLAIVEEEERWLAGICPQSYLQMINQSIFVIVGSNSKKADMDDTALAMPRILNKNSRCFYVAGMLDTLTTEVKDSIDSWICKSRRMEKAPSLPKIEIDAEKGKLFASVTTNAEAFSIWYARGEKINRLNWVCPDVEKTDFGGKAVIEIYDEKLPVSVFVNAEFDGLCISSDVITFEPCDIGKNLELGDYTRMIYNQTMGLGEFIPIDVLGDNLLWDKSSVVYAKGPLGIGGISGKRFGTFALAENMILRHFESVLIFDVCSDVKQELEVCIVQNWNEKQCKYRAKINLLGGNMWQKIVISGQDFRSAAGKTLSADCVGGLSLLAFAANEDIIVTNILFT